MRTRKGLLLLLMLVMSISVFARGTDESSDEAAAAGDETLELSIYMNTGTLRFNEDWLTYKKAADITGVSLTGTAPPPSDKKRQFEIMVASGEYADIIVLPGNGEFAYQYGPEGLFQPLDDLIEEHAPNIKKAFEEHEDLAKRLVTEDGHIYHIPNFQALSVSKIYFLRKDWVDKLGLEMPETTEEYIEVLRAFMNEDPNGNGEKDEVPFFSRAPGDVGQLLRWNDCIDWWQVEDGKVMLGYYNKPEVLKKAMGELVKWYQEGLVDEEIFTRKRKSRDILLGENRGGMTFDWFASTSGYNDKLSDKIPGFELVPVAPPVTPSGKQVQVSNRPGMYGGWGISKDNEYPVETIKYMDFWYSEEGRMLREFGVEGVHYKMVDGAPEFIWSAFDQTIGSKVDMLAAEGLVGAASVGDPRKELLLIENPYARKGIEMYMKNGYLKQRFPSPLPRTEVEQKVFDEIGKACNQYYSEMKQKWFLGAEEFNDESFARYLTTLKKMGVEELIATTQAAYDRYMQE